jgi:hypothetical protein
MANKAQKKSQPVNCPSCGGALSVARLKCAGCGTAVEGEFPLPMLSRLDTEEQKFALSFIKASGSLKEMARVYKVSYPTMRNKLDAMIARIKELETGGR